MIHSYVQKNSSSITGCNSFQNNTARDRDSLGGAIHIIDGDLLITNTTCTSFTGNKADAGGAIYLYQSTASIKGDVYFEENSATTGGAIGTRDQYSSLITGDKVCFINNVADDNGGAIGFATISFIAIHQRKLLLNFT